MVSSITLVPIEEQIEDNKQFTDNPKCQDSIYMSINFYKKVGFNPPWIGYYALAGEELIGCAAFKGKPLDGKVEIAYGTFPEHRQKGIGTAIAATLVQLSLKTDPSIIITARTLPEENFSARILRKNNFRLLGTIIDREDGEVWEWVYAPAKMDAMS